MTWYNPLTWFKSKPDSSNKIQQEISKSQSYRKKADTTKITKQMYDFILLKKEERDAYNLYRQESESYHTTEDLCSYLNMCLGTNFSRSKLTQVWTGKLDREKLPEGPEITIPF